MESERVEVKQESAQGGVSIKMAESATQGIRRECKVGTGNGMQMWKG